MKQQPPDLVIPFCPPADLIYSSTNLDGEGTALLRVGMLGEKYYGFFYSDGPRFAVERKGLEIWADWPDEYSLEDAATYLAGPVLGFLFRLRGILPLHASAVVLGEWAIALMGPPGAGKSTTAAAFARMGCAVLSEDVAVLDERSETIRVEPGYPRVNMWPDSVESLFGSAEALPLVTPAWGKRYLELGVSGYRFQKESLPLALVYVLEPREEGLKDTVIEERAISAALPVLVANTYVNYLLDARMREQEFKSLGRLLASVPVRFVRSPEDPKRIDQLCETIREDARKIRGMSSAVVCRGRSQNV